VAVVLPDPGADRVRGAVRWRTLPGQDELLDSLRSLRFDRWPELLEHDAGMKRRAGAFWGRLRAGGVDYFVKGRRILKTRRLLRSMLRPAPMRVEWRKTWWARSVGIDTVEPVAVGEVRRFGALLEEYLVCRWLPDAQPIVPYLEGRRQRLDDRAFSRLFHELTEEAGRLFGTLQAHGAAHRQFHDHNLLVLESSTRRRLLAIDFDHVTIEAALSLEDRAWNFFQLAYYLRVPMQRFPIGPGTRMRFLRGYRAGAPALVDDLPELYRWIARWWPARPPLEHKPRRREFLDRLHGPDPAGPGA
jgi:hypothetical protein